jgi:tetratricopeptide (TPR) repeat protein
METSQQFFEQGLDFQERGLFDLAIQEYNKALEADPENIDALVNLGTAYLQKGLPEKSTQVLNRALLCAPEHPQALFNLGKVYLYREETPKALDMFEKAVKVLPEDVEVKKSIAQCLFLLDRKRDAVNTLLPIKSEILTDLNTTLQLGRELIDMESFTDALDVFRKAVTAFPDSADALGGLIRCQQELGMKDKALTSLRRALMVHPQDPHFNVMMVDHLLESGTLDEAVSLLKKATAANPTNGSLRAKMDEIARKMPILKKRAGSPGLVEKHSQFETEVYDILDALYDSRMNLEAAIRNMRELRARDTADLFIADELANLLFQAKKYEEAMDLYGEIQKSAPRESRHRINFAKCLALTGNTSLAQEYIQDSLKEFPYDAELGLSLVEMKLFGKDYQGAGRVLEKTLQVSPDNVHGLFLQGYISMRTGNLDFAAETFKRVLRLAPDDEEVVVWYSRLMILLGNPDPAIGAWKSFQDNIESLTEIITLIELHIAKGDYSRMNELLGRIGNYQPRFLEDHLMFGKVFFYAREYKRSQEAMEEVLKQDPQHPEALAFLALVQLIKNKTAKFWMLWQKALESDSFYVALTTLVLAKTLNFPQLERLKGETKKIYDISLRDDIDRVRIGYLLKRL